MLRVTSSCYRAFFCMQVVKCIICLCLYIYIYIYRERETYTCIYIYMYIYIHIHTYTYIIHNNNNNKYLLLLWYLPAELLPASLAGRLLPPGRGHGPELQLAPSDYNLPWYNILSIIHYPISCYLYYAMLYYTILYHTLDAEARSRLRDLPFFGGFVLARPPAGLTATGVFGVDSVWDVYRCVYIHDDIEADEQHICACMRYVACLRMYACPYCTYVRTVRVCTYLCTHVRVYTNVVK